MTPPPDNNDLIPMGAPSANFDVVMRGYDRNQVLTEFRRLEDDLRTLVSEREAAVKHAKDVRKKLEAARTENGELKQQLNQNEPPSFENMGGRIASMLRLAEEEAAEIRAAAQRDADQTRESATKERSDVDADLASKRAEAEQYAADVRAEADDVLAKAKAEAAEHLDSRHKQAEEHLSKAQAKAADLIAASEAKRASAEEDFEIALRHRRTAAHKDESERDERSRAEAAARIQEARETAADLASTAHADATRTVDEANQRARAMISEAQDEVHRLQQVRTNLAAQIHSIGQLVSGVPAQLAIAPEDLDPNREIEAPSASAPAEPELTGTPRDQQAAAVLAESMATDQPRQPEVDQPRDAEVDSSGEAHQQAADQGEGPNGVPAAEAPDQPAPEQHAPEAEAHDAASAQQPEDSTETGPDEVTDTEAAAETEVVDATVQLEPNQQPGVPQHAGATPQSAPGVAAQQKAAALASGVRSDEPAERTRQISAIRPRRPRR
ncbi:hypothetical protein EK0264_16510 [Epidermidibacterium keratini]|uniref:Cell division protein DivIVA n=1 Tax=Epidermidibacterium keratini TaxID=1891644 RepID=A0A7L4YT72_9ACTN|nr:hypothetical protein [Epidermidibacterium keratini]QHC01727.1 hypothetical protein EK0264_16510 [Epidermidibacterium keratini]